METLEDPGTVEDLASLATLIDEPAAPPPPFNLRIHHCSISVPDLDASIDWYRKMLGFSVEYRMRLPTGRGSYLQGSFLRRGAIRIELFQHPDSQPSPEDRRDPIEDLATCGTKHMALEVNDIQAAYDYLTSHDVEVALPITDGGGMVICYVRDNSGTLIELVEHRDARRTVA